MTCSLKAKQETRSLLTEAIRNNNANLGSIAFDGTSYDLIDAFYRQQSANAKSPLDVKEAFEQRTTLTSRPFHRALRRELGEVVYLEVGGKAKKHYMLASGLRNSPNSPGGVVVDLRLAPHDNINDVTTYSFEVGSDVAMEGPTLGEGTIEGLGDLTADVIVSHYNKLKSDKANVSINHEGDKDLNDTLTKMTKADVRLGSRQSRGASSLVDYEQVDDYAHGNIKAMKEMLNKLHVLGNSKATEQQMDYYTELLERMHPRFFNEMKLWLKKKGDKALGDVRLNDKVIAIEASPNPKKHSYQSEAEVYIHEVIHTMTAWALRSKLPGVSRLTTQLNHAMQVLQKHTTFEDFLAVPLEDAGPREIAEAEEMYRYFFLGDKSSQSRLDEFTAGVLTNPHLMAKAKAVMMSQGAKETKSVFQRVVATFTKLMDAVLGRYDFRSADISIFDQVNDIAFQLAEVNQAAQSKLQKSNPLGKFIDAFNSMDSAAALEVEKFKKKIGNTDKRFNPPAEDAGVYANAKYLLNFGVGVLTNPLHRGFFGLWASAHWMKPGGTIREIMGSFFEKTPAMRIAEGMKLLGDRTDATRNAEIDATYAKLQAGFRKPLTQAEDEALTAVMLDTNLSGLRYKRLRSGKRTDADTRKLLRNDEYLHQQVGRAKSSIEKQLKGASPARKNWVKEQAVSLGYYMATGKAHLAQNFNAENIVRGIGTNEWHEANQGLAETIEELATLVALTYTDGKQKRLVAELISSDAPGVNQMVDTYEAYKRASRKHLFAGKGVHYMLGHTKEIYDDTIDMITAPVSQRGELEARGFTLRYVLPTKGGVKFSSPMAMYTTGTWGKAERQRGAVALGKPQAKGSTITSLMEYEGAGIAKEYAARDIAKLKIEAMKLHEQMANGTFDVSKVEYGIAPVLNSGGIVQDFRFMMTKENKKKLLNQDTTATQVLARSAASIVGSMEADKLNADILVALKKDMAENWVKGELGEDGYTEFTLIGPEVPDPAMRTLFAQLPEEYQAFIGSRKDKTLAVRSSLMPIYFGGHHMKLSNLKGIHLLPGMVKHAIDVVEGIWMEFVKISKAAVLMKMPIILVENVVSNIRFMISTGSLDITELFRDYKDSFREVDEYLATNRKATALAAELAADREALGRVRDRKVLEGKIKRKEVQLELLQNILHSSPAGRLFAMGLYQTHVEGLEGSALGESNLVAKKANAALAKVPAPVRVTAQVAYLTQNTEWYKFMQETMQRTDMVSRLAEYKRESRKIVRQVDGVDRLPAWWLVDKEKGYPVTKALKGKERAEFLEQADKVMVNGLIDHYINYTLPNGKTEEYLNRMGVLMFTKYVKRVQRVVTQSVMSNPLKTSIGLIMGQVFPSLELFQEQSLIARGFGADGEFSLANMLPVYSLPYHLQNVFVPALVKEETYMGLAF